MVCRFCKSPIFKIFLKNGLNLIKNLPASLCEIKTYSILFHIMLFRDF